MKKTIERLTTFGIVFSACGILFYWMYYVNGDMDYSKVNSKDDLVEVVGEFESFKMKGSIGSRDYEYHTLIKLKKNNSSFRIARDAESNLNLKAFKKGVKKGEEIHLLIPKKELNKPNRNGDTRVFGISDDKTTYLDVEQSIKDVNTGQAVVAWMVGLFAVVGPLLLIIGRILKRRKMGN
jgi:hypothetical protein